jgi:hypothetical protein
LPALGLKRTHPVMTPLLSAFSRPTPSAPGMLPPKSACRFLCLIAGRVHGKQPDSFRCVVQDRLAVCALRSSYNHPSISTPPSATVLRSSQGMRC